MTQHNGAEQSSRVLPQDLFTRYNSQTKNPDGSVEYGRPKTQAVMRTDQSKDFFKKFVDDSHPAAGVTKTYVSANVVEVPDPSTQRSAQFQGRVLVHGYSPSEDSLPATAYEVEVVRCDGGAEPEPVVSFMTLKPGCLGIMAALHQGGDWAPLTSDRDRSLASMYAGIALQLGFNVER